MSCSAPIFEAPIFEKRALEFFDIAIFKYDHNL